MRIPPNRPLRRRALSPTLCESAEQQWRRIVARTGELRRQGRPVLIGTRSVLASETVSGCLTDAALEHVMLNADQDSNEAQIIAQAGKPQADHRGGSKCGHRQQLCGSNCGHP